MKHLRLVVGSVFGAFTLVSAQTTFRDRWEPNDEWLKEPRFYGRPAKGFVTKKSTAIAIARAAILDRYDSDLLSQLEPLDAKRFSDEWVVYSYFPKPKKGQPVAGGVTTVEISASTGTILNFWRER